MIWLLSSRSGASELGCGWQGRLSLPLVSPTQRAQPLLCCQETTTCQNFRQGTRFQLTGTQFGDRYGSCGGAVLGPGDLADAERDSSLQSSKAGWLITQMGSGSAADEGAHGAGKVLRSAPTPGGLAPCQLRVEGRGQAGSPHVGNSCKDPAVLEMSPRITSCGGFGGWGGGEMEAGVLPQCFFFFFFFLPRPHSWRGVGERGVRVSHVI